MSKGKLIGLALAVALMPQLARCQAAGDGTTNVNKAAAAPAVAVSVGPFVATNTCLIATASDANALKCELAAEVNKAKTELAEQNRERMDALGEKYEAKHKEAVADVESRSKQRFDELKGVVDEEKDTIDKTLNLWSIIFAFLGVLATIVGIGVSIWLGVREVKRGRQYEQLKSDVDSRKAEYDTLKSDVDSRKAEYDTLKGELEQRKADYEKLEKSLKDQQKSQAEQFAKNLEQQKADSEKLIDELKDQQKSQAEQFAKAMGKLEKELITCKKDITFSHGEQYWICYKNSKDVDDARLAIMNFAKAILWSVKGNLVLELSNTISWLNAIDKQLTFDRNKSKVQDMLKNWHWEVSPDEVRKVLDAAKPEKIVKNGTSATFERIYKEYGLPKV